MTEPMSLPFESWPAPDRAAWTENCAQKPLLDRRGFAALTAASKRLAMRAYGRWLLWLEQQGLLEDHSPSERLNAERFLQFAKAENERGLAPTTLANVLWSLIIASERMCPEADLTSMRSIARRASHRARQAPRPRPFIVHATKMFSLGLTLMEQAKSEAAAALDEYVDGLIIGLMTSCPLRIGDFSQLHLRHEIIRGESEWRVVINEQKTSRCRTWPVHPDLTGPIDYYVQVVRDQLLRRKKKGISTERFFIGRSGLPLGDQVMRRRIEAVTEAAFGKPILPHSFRKLAVTTFVLEAPEEAAFASDLLGHRDRRVTEDHYLLGNQLIAARRYHECLERYRKRPGSSNPEVVYDAT